MHLNDLSRRAWAIAETKGLHANLNGVTELGVREQALLAVVPLSLALNALIQSVKKKGINEGILGSTLTPLLGDLYNALDALAVKLRFYADPASHPLEVEIEDKTPGTAIRLLLMGTEVCEALEALYDDKPIAGELADVFIRGADLAEDLHINLDSTVIRVLEANEQRPYAYGTPAEHPLPEKEHGFDPEDFIHIPAGPFLMGSDPARDPVAFQNEMPQHTVVLPNYYLSRHPVTVAQFRAFVEANNHEPADPRSLQGLSNHPVVYVNWYEALTYCTWLTERLRTWDGTPLPLATLIRDQGWQVTLPSEAEWEKAARGTTGMIYPWGNTFEATRAHTEATGIGETSPVGYFPPGASPYGLMDMSGNVWEWTRGLWEFSYPYNARDGRENLHAPADSFRVLRGGAFWLDHQFVRCAYRGRLDARVVDGNFGFRVALCPPLDSGDSHG